MKLKHEVIELDNRVTSLEKNIISHNAHKDKLKKQKAEEDRRIMFQHFEQLYAQYSNLKHSIRFNKHLLLMIPVEEEYKGLIPEYQEDEIMKSNTRSEDLKLVEFT